MTNNKLTSREAILTAIEAADLRKNSPACSRVCLVGDLYEITLHCCFMKYEFYVDAMSGEVCGLNTEPELGVEEIVSYSFESSPDYAA